MELWQICWYGGLLAIFLTMLGIWIGINLEEKDKLLEVKYLEDRLDYSAKLMNALLNSSRSGYTKNTKMWIAENASDFIEKKGKIDQKVLDGCSMQT